MQRSTRTTLLALALTGMSACAAAVHQQLYLPSPLDQPAEVWARANAASPFTARTEDGMTLTGLHLKPAGAAKATILYLHGNAGNLVSAAKFAQPIAALGYDVYAVSYRGYSGNAGTPSEQGLMRDGQAFLDYVRSNGNGEPIILLGYSLGGSLALQLAARNEVAGVVTLGAFRDLRAMLPAAVRSAAADTYDNVAAIGAVTEPVLLIHGTADQIIPFAHARELKDASQHRNVRLMRLDGAGHHLDPEEFGRVFDEQVSLMPLSGKPGLP